MCNSEAKSRKEVERLMRKVAAQAGTIASWELDTCAEARAILWDVHVDQGQPMLWRTTKGHSLLLVHGGEDGSLSAPKQMIEQADIIVCCHPMQVKRAHPQHSKKVFGWWEGTTGSVLLCGRLWVLNTKQVELYMKLLHPAS